MKRYFRTVLRVSRQEVELVESELFSHGCLGVEVKEEGKEVSLIAYFPQEVNISFSDKVVEKGFIEDRDWNEEWKKHFKPVRVSENVWVAPSWLRGEFPEGGKHVIYVHPGQAFGTGTHETTQLCMKLIERFLKEKDSFLDVGIGSGILSILARKLGASKVIGCDVQEEAIEEVKLNSQLNGVSGIEVFHGSVEAIPYNGFDFVVANIEKHLLLPILHGIVLKGKRSFVFSGILQHQREEFLNALNREGLRVILEEGAGEWIAFYCEK